MKFKNLLAITLVSFSLISAPVKKADAGVAALSIFTPVGPSLASLIGLGVALGGIGMIRALEIKSSSWVIPVMFGVILLDENTQPSFSYDKLDGQAAGQLGLTEGERVSFNRVVAPVGQVAKIIGKKCSRSLLADLEKGHEITKEQLLEVNRCTNQKWQDYQKANPSLLTDEVMSAISAIRSQELKK